MAVGRHFVQKSLPTISDQYHNYIFVKCVYKMAAGGHFGCLKLTFDGISGHFKSIQNSFFLIFTKWPPAPIFGCPKFIFDRIFGHFISILNFFLIFFTKWQPTPIFGCPKFTYDHISGHFRSIRKFIYFINFWQNGCRRLFWMSKIHFWWHFWPFQINTKLLFFYFLQNGRRHPFWMSEIRISGHFISISKFNFSWNSWQNGCRRPFWMSEIHFQSHFWPF